MRHDRIGVRPRRDAKGSIATAQSRGISLETVFRYANVYQKAIDLAATDAVDLSRFVSETFAFDETADGTRLSYSGELGTDLWRLGQAWGDLVARSWLDAVRDSMAVIKTESERRTQG